MTAILTATGKRREIGAFEDSAIHDDVAGEINAITEKASPVSGDLLIIEDSAASNAKKKVQVGNLPGSSNVPSCRVYNSADITLPDVTWTVVTFNSERYDTDTMHSTSTNTSRITFNTAGKYHVGTSVRITGTGSATIKGARILLNGATPIASAFLSTTSDWRCTVSCDYEFAQNDYVEVSAYQNSGGSTLVSAAANSSPEFWAHRITA